MQLIKNLTKNKRYIAFIGDSFCATTSHEHNKLSKAPAVNGQGTADVAFPSLVADHYDLNLLAHGYGGKSWWYSRVQFLKQVSKTPKLLTKLDAMVFCHTNHHRINSDNPYTDSSNHSDGRSAQDYINEEERQVAKAQLQWTKHLYDNNFQQWAQTNWFREISREWSEIKQVHFHCFEHLENQNNHLLVGQRFTTPLVYVSVAELAGSLREVRNQLTSDTRANHMSAENNRVMAEITINALDNYKHGVQPLDMSKFKNLVNPNYANFPHGNFGSH